MAPAGGLAIGLAFGIGVHLCIKWMVRFGAGIAEQVRPPYPHYHACFLFFAPLLRSWGLVNSHACLHATFVPCDFIPLLFLTM